MTTPIKGIERRRKPPQDRKSITHKATIGGHELYMTAGMFEDGTLAEVFIKGVGKEGSTVQGLLDAWATMFSIGLQYGAEFDTLARKFAEVRFEPMGYTDSEQIPWSASMIDYIMRWLAIHFGTPQLRAELDKIAKEMRG